MVGRPSKSVKRSGATLAIVLWTMVALGALALAAAGAARIETVLQGRYRDHAAALSLAEAGLAEARSALAGNPARVRDSLAGALELGRYEVRWEPVGDDVRVVSEGVVGTAVRTIEARVTIGADEPGLAAWRERW